MFGVQVPGFERSFVLTEIGETTNSTKTKEATRYAVNIIQEYLHAMGRGTSFEFLEASELNMCLADFFMNVRSRNGEIYSKNSLMSIRQGIRRHLQSAPFFRDFDIVTDSRFLEANAALKAAMKVSDLCKPNKHHIKPESFNL